jgi:hypothetical protein
MVHRDPKSQGTSAKIFRASKMIQGREELATVDAILEIQKQVLRDKPENPPLSAGTGGG